MSKKKMRSIPRLLINTPSRKHLRPWFATVITSALLFACTKEAALDGVKPAKATVEAVVTPTSSGTVEAVKQAILGFNSAGRVALVEVEAGDHVKEGQLLAALENDDLKSLTNNSIKTFERDQALHKQGALSQEIFDQSRDHLEQSKSSLEKTIIRAPFSGLVTEVNLKKGEVYQPMTDAAIKAPIAIVDLEPRLVKAEIDELDLGRVKLGDEVRVKVSAYRKDPLKGKIKKVIPYVSTNRDQDRTSKIEITITEETKNPIPVGASADAEIVVQRKDNVLAIPSRTILGSSAERYVYRYVEGEGLKKTPVKIGIGDYDKTEVLEGLGDGDIVVYPGEKVTLQDGMKGKLEVKPWP